MTIFIVTSFNLLLDNGILKILQCDLKSIIEAAQPAGDITSLYMLVFKISLVMFLILSITKGFPVLEFPCILM